MIHENVQITRVNGTYVVEWQDGEPSPGDTVLMSVELFEQSIERLNEKLSFLGEGKWPTYPGHDMAETIGACRPNWPCPVCRRITEDCYCPPGDTKPPGC